MSRDGNLANLSSEIQKQQDNVREQIVALDNEVLTKPEVMPS